jgi:hypothetical protein
MKKILIKKFKLKKTKKKLWVTDVFFKMNGKSHKKRKQERKYLRMKPKKNELKKAKKNK